MADYKILTIPFGRDAVPDMVNDIPSDPIVAEPQRASFKQGFPSITTIPLVAGGIPPEGQDFNGILRDITQHIVHQNKGGMYKFAPEVVAAGGYAKGAVLASNDNLSLWVSLQNNNVQDFNGPTKNQWARIAFSGLDALLNGKADKAVSINAGNGLTGGGDLSANRTLSVNYGTTAGTAAAGNDSRITGAVQKSAVVQLTGVSTTDIMSQKAVTDALAGKANSSVTLTAGTGLSGGGDLSANRTLSVNYGTTAGTAAQGNDSRITGAAQKSANLSDLTNVATARTNLGLGTAATNNAQTSPTDTTAGALMAVGAFGLGGLNAVISGTDLNALSKTGFYMGDRLVNAPSSSAGWFYVLHQEHGGSGYSSQIAIDLTSPTPETYQRLKVSGTWHTWQELLHTGNISTASVAYAATAGSANTADTANTALNALGVGQTWRDVTSSRALNTAYTNTTGKPIQLYITGDLNDSTITIGGVPLTGRDYNGGSFISPIVPVGATYSLSATSSAGLKWLELR